MNLAAAAATTQMSYSDLKREVASGRVQTLEQLVSLLPRAQRSRYSFVYESRSAQFASPEFPRVIIYGEDAKTLLAFSGDQSRPQSGKLEIIEWDEASRSFQFHEIVFPDGHTPQRRVQINEHPTSCLRCHQAPPRPNWDPYNFWPGVYGSLERFKMTVIAKDSTEARNYSKFLTENRNQGLYRLLPMEVSRGGDPRIDLHAPKYQQVLSRFDVVADAVAFVPNGNLNDLLSILNYTRIAHELVTSPSFDRMKYALLGLVACTGNLTADDERTFGLTYESFFPHDSSSPSLSAFIAQTVADARVEHQARAQRLVGQNNSTGLPEYEPLFFLTPDSPTYADTILGAYFARRFGFNVANWSMAFDQATYAFDAGRSNIGIRGGIRQPLLRELLALHDPELGPFLAELNTSSLTLDAPKCLNLAARSRQASANDSHSRLAVRSGQSLARSCDHCHHEGIPFGNRRALSTLLSSDRGQAILAKIESRLEPENPRRMPKNGPPLSEAEKQALLNYLRRLARPRH